VRVRRGKTTAFVCVDIAGGATGSALRVAAARALGAPVLLFKPGNGGVPLDDGSTLSGQGVGVDDLVIACFRMHGSDSEWETPGVAKGAC
jgi:hypothetical protein